MIHGASWPPRKDVGVWVLVLRQHRLALQQQALQPHDACQRHVSDWAVGRRAAGRAGGRGGGSGSGKRRGFAGCPVATPGGVVRGAHDLCPLVHNRRVLPKDGLRRFCAQRSESCGAPAAGAGRGGGGGAHLHCRPLLHENVVVRRVVPATPPVHGVSMCRCPGSIVAPGSSPAPAQKRGEPRTGR